MPPKNKDNKLSLLGISRKYICLILCDDSVCICKMKKNKVPYHALANKLLVE